MSIRPFAVLNLSLLGLATTLAAAPVAPVAAEDDAAAPDARSSRYLRIRRGAATNEALPSVYVVRMKGQMGTDVNSQLYEDIRDDILEKDPDLIIIKMDCKDNDQRLYSEMTPVEESLADFDDYYELIDLFRIQLAGYKQIMWIEDAVGFSAPVALSWPTIYMTPEARLGKMDAVFDKTGADKWADEDVRGKMTAAIMGLTERFLEHGGHDLKLASAMVIKEHTLSASWRGRDVIWSLSDKGEYAVDTSDEHVTEFDAKSAEDFSISSGTASTLDDLALLHGLREYRIVGEDGEEIVDDYVENWRRMFDQSKGWWLDYNQHMGWATGDETVKWLGRAKSDLTKILGAMKRYKAVEVRWQMEIGAGIYQIESLIEQIKERLRALKQGERGGRGGAGRGRGGGSGRLG